MAGELVITAVGNLTADPEVKTVGGATLASFSIAVTARSYDREAGAFVDGKTTFVRCSAWRELGDHVAASLTKGSRVIAQGRFEQRDYEVDGQKRSAYELQVDEIGPSLRYATAAVERAQTNRNQQTRREQYAQQSGRGHDGAPAGASTQQVMGGRQQGSSWGGGYDDETPF